MSAGLDIVIYANAPTAATGFGTVIRQIFGNLVARKQVPLGALSFHGINYFGQPHDFPWAKIWPAQQVGDSDPFGRKSFADQLLSGWWPCDVLFLLEDHFHMSAHIPFRDGRTEPFIPGLIGRMRAQVQAGQRKPFRVVQYIPVDSETLWPEWVYPIAECVDYPVAYTHFGARVLLEIEPRLESRLSVIPHGTDPETYFPVPPQVRGEFRRRTFGIEDDVPLIVNVNRNQARKDIVRTLQVFARLRDWFPDAVLYLHCSPADSKGFHLDRARLNLRLPDRSVLWPEVDSEITNYPEHVLNLVYNSADVFVTTSRGEGWGLCVSDAVTCGVPVVAPDHTSHTDILRDGRGVLVPCREWQVQREDWDQLRPVADVEEMAIAVGCVLLDRGFEPAVDNYPKFMDDEVHVAAMTDRALSWARALSWRDAVVPMWERIFTHAGQALGKFEPPSVVRSFQEASAT